MVIIVFGLPGSGKSYFASRLSQLMSAHYINSDRVRKKLFKKSVYSKEEKESIYNHMLEATKEFVKNGKHVVLDATFHKSETREPFIESMKGKGGIQFIEVEANENIIRERLKKKRPYSEADFEIYKKIRQHYEPLEEPHLVLQSTDNDIENMLQKASFYLKWKHDNPTNK